MKFVGSLYGKNNCVSLNSLRCEKAGKNIPGKKLPPTEDSFRLHVRRCVCQLMVWRNANIPMHDTIDPVEFGYEKEQETGILQPQLMCQSPAAPELLNDIVCMCPSNNCLEDCTCLSNGQACTWACSCEASTEDIDENNCTNPLTLEAWESQAVDTDSD
ncbi:MAG: hypothetical protein N0C90_06110 [Candidatus Thiodiazotropha endolucinida]|nr:hypothetical protein [Candidatus Thiodiazotropha taylori]MCW4260923.1 hypothetical protein [Candidatus Thiodiazotropha endolucinida]